MADHTNLPVNSVGVVLSGGLGVVWLGWLPPAIACIASVLAAAWYTIEIWESRTVKRWRRARGWNVPVEDDEI